MWVVLGYSGMTWKSGVVEDSNSHHTKPTAHGSVTLSTQPPVVSGVGGEAVSELAGFVWLRVVVLFPHSAGQEEGMRQREGGQQKEGVQQEGWLPGLWQASGRKAN